MYKVIKERKDFCEKLLSTHERPARGQRPPASRCRKGAGAYEPAGIPAVRIRARAYADTFADKGRSILWSVSRLFMRTDR